MRIGYVFPVKKNRILFSSYEGMQYTCNPKYIFQGIHEKYGKNYEYIWVLNKPDNLPEEYRKDVKIVRFLSVKHLFYLLTSRFIISNLGIEPILPKRKSQIFINTWHGGGAYKVVSYDMKIFSKSERFYIRHMQNIRRKGTDFFLSSCSKFTEVSSRDFYIETERFVPSGLPRNDRFIKPNRTQNDALKKRLIKEFDIPEGNLIVLYAPTFRGSHRKQENIDNNVCSQQVYQALNKKFGHPVTFLFRRHISKNNDFNPGHLSNLHIVDVTKYPDMQDLLEIADVLITDYSSSIWDFCLTKKPAFLYTPDFGKYLDDRGFYTPIDTWPYTYAISVNELCKNINEYDIKNNEDKINAHLMLLGSFEKGTSISNIEEIIKNNQ